MQLGDHIFISNKKPRHRKAFRLKVNAPHRKTISEMFDDSLFKVPRFYRKKDNFFKRKQKINYFAPLKEVQKQLKKQDKKGRSFNNFGKKIIL